MVTESKGINPFNSISGHIQDVSNYLNGQLGLSGSDLLTAMAYAAKAENRPGLDAIARILRNMVPTFHLDADADPIVPNGYRLEEHSRMGQVVLDRKGDLLYANGHITQLVTWGVSTPDTGEAAKGGFEEAHWEIFNATFGDFLYEHQSLIPRHWSMVIFLSSVFVNLATKEREALCLYKHNGVWRKTYQPLRSRLSRGQYALRLV